MYQCLVRAIFLKYNQRSKLTFQTEMFAAVYKQWQVSHSNESYSTNIHASFMDSLQAH